MSNRTKNSIVPTTSIAHILRATTLIAVLSLTMFSSVADAALTTKEWRDQMIRIPPPKAGCFEAHYPSFEWIKVACGDSSLLDPATIGGGGTNDWHGNQQGSLAIGSAQGQFTAASGITSKTDSVRGTNSYGIQLNSKSWSCTYSSTSTTCWQQFMFQNRPSPAPNNGVAGIQRWLLGWVSSCPAGWNPYPPPPATQTSCYKNSLTSTFSHINPTNTNLTLISLYGQVNNAVGNDYVNFCFNGTCYSTQTSATEFNPGLYQVWKDVEWNIFGTGSASTAYFNGVGGTGVSMSIQVNMWDSTGTAIFPNCTAESYTAEMANLNKGAGCTATTGYYTFSQSN